MKKVIRLTESDLIRLVKRVVREQEEWSQDDEDKIKFLGQQRSNLMKKGENIPYLKNYAVDGEYTDDSYDRFKQDFDKWDEDSGYNELGRQIKSIADRRPKIQEPGITKENKWEVIGQLQDKIQKLNNEIPRYDVNSDEDFESVYEKYLKWQSKVDSIKDRIGRIMKTNV